MPLRQVFTASEPSVSDKCWFYVTAEKKQMCGLTIGHKGPCRPKPRVEVWYRQVSKSMNLGTVAIFKVCMDGKEAVTFPNWWAAFAFAVYAFRHPDTMADRKVI